MYKDKKPDPSLLPNHSWLEYQHRPPTEAEVKQWFSEGAHNIGIVTGRVSRVVVVDLDSEEAIEWAKGNIDTDTLTVKTGKGYHLYYTYPKGIDIPNKVKLNGMGIDIRGNGGYAVAPPSTHKDGKQYYITKNTEIKTLPIVLLERIQNDTTLNMRVTPDDFSGVEEGERHNRLTRLAGHFAGVRYPLEKAIRLCLDWNKQNHPPLSEREVVNIVMSIYKSEEQKVQGKKQKAEPKQQTKTKRAIDVIKRNIDEIFTDQYKDFFAVLKNGEYYPIRSKKFKRIAQRLYNETYNEPISDDTIRDAISNVEAMADKYTNIRELNIRVAEHEGKLYYHLGEFKGIEVTQGNWRVVEKIPPIFRVLDHQILQSIPDPNASIEDIWDIFRLVNIKGEEYRILFLVYLLYTFIPKYSYPVLILYGDQGAGKSTVQKVLKDIIDPDTVKLIPIRSGDDLRVIAGHHHLLAYDNLSHISQRLSDELSKIATGGGSAKRSLYSNNDISQWVYKNPQCISGINLVADAPDLMDRSILIKLDRQTMAERLTEKNLEERLKELKPKILGAIFHILSKVWQNTPKINYPLLRMADFSLYGYHLAEAMGMSGVKFLEAYRKNRLHSTEELIENTPLANLIIAHLDKYHHFEGNPNQLLNELKEIANELNMSNDLPKNSIWLMRKLNILKTNLQEIGIVIEETRDQYRRVITIKKQETNDTLPEGYPDRPPGADFK